ncbi:MAG TPA: nuclear transport factor 2 family protein [Actinomycetota bacterium]|jgi:ketosteroid isomerase-like protein|nr:nuclear transport factor 2 family protein [Actinomycetota bacterium]
MSADKPEQEEAISERLSRAMNAHDLEAHVACFDEAYRSEQPAHPSRTFTGREQVRKNWSGLYASIPDFRAEILRLAVVGDTEWAEWHWQGTKEDGAPLDERGVTIVGIRDGRIEWGRLYLEEVEGAGADIEETVRHMAGRKEER